MANRCTLIQNICGSVSRSNMVKVGLSDSVNLYPETQNPTEHSTQLIMRSIAGCKKFVSYELDGPCRGMYRVSTGIDGQPTLYAVFGSKLYIIGKNGSAYAVASIPTSGTEVRMCETQGYGASHPHLLMVDGTNCYAVDVTLPISMQMADFRLIELPVKVNDRYTRIHPTHVAYLYGYAVINDAGTDATYVSYQYPFLQPTDGDQIDYDIWRLSSTDGLGYIQYAEWCQDNTTALCSNNSKLYTFGPRSFQCWSYTQDKNMPLSSPDNAAANIGLKAINSLCILGTSVLFLGSSDIGENAVYMLSDTTPKRVSTSDIERELSMMVNAENAYASLWQEHRHVFYSLTFEDSHLTYVYDVTENMWHRRASFDIRKNLDYWRYSHATFAYGKTMVASGNNLCCMDENVYEEHDGMPIFKMRRGGCITSNDQPFFVDSAEIVVNNGQQQGDLFNLIDGELKQPGDTDLNPRISVRYSWDGGNWSDYEDYYLGKIGEYAWSTVIWEMGMGRYLTVEVSTSEKIPFCIQQFKMAWEQGADF